MFKVTGPGSLSSESIDKDVNTKPWGTSALKDEDSERQRRKNSQWVGRGRQNSGRCDVVGVKKRKCFLKEKISQLWWILLLKVLLRWSRTIALGKIENDSNFDISNWKGMIGMKAELQWVEKRTRDDEMETSADNLFTFVVSVTT